MYATSYICFIIRINFSLLPLQVELWLETLHNRRVEVTALFTRAKKELDNSLYLTRNDDELIELGALISEKKNNLMHLDSLGSSIPSVEELLNTLIKLKYEADGISQRCIEIAKTQQVNNCLILLI